VGRVRREGCRRQNAIAPAHRPERLLAEAIELGPFQPHGHRQGLGQCEVPGHLPLAPADGFLDRSQAGCQFGRPARGICKLPDHLEDPGMLVFLQSHFPPQSCHRGHVEEAAIEVGVEAGHPFLQIDQHIQYRMSTHLRFPLTG
jgi:hypothetical protein